MEDERPKIGIALGSGGARGLIHIGVLKVLEENDIPIDFIAGASVGSIVGSYYALNKEIKSLNEKITQLTKKDLVKLIDIASPKRALISGHKIEKFLKELIKDSSFSDLQIPLTIIATNMSTGKETHIREGKLIDAMRASISLPGILPPAKIKDDFFLDGGIVNPTPVDVVKNMGADIVIGVDLTMNQPVKIENPSIVDTLRRSFEILRTRTTELNIGKIDDNTIIIKTNKAKIVDTYRFYDHKFITEGEKTAKKYLPKIEEAIRNWEEKQGDNDEI